MPRFLWRVDTRPPEIIFREGFAGVGETRTFFNHIVSGNFGRDWFVSTAESPSAAIRYFTSWSRPHVTSYARYAYLYQIRADERIYNARATGEHLYSYIMSDEIVYVEGDRWMARTAIRALRTSFAYQREWFSDGPILPEQVVSAFFIFSAPVHNGYIHHPVGRVLEAPWIDEPEIMNPWYVDEPTEANENPWNPTNPIQVPVRVFIPEEVEIDEPEEPEEPDLPGGAWGPIPFDAAIPHLPGSRRFKRGDLDRISKKYSRKSHGKTKFKTSVVRVTDMMEMYEANENVNKDFETEIFLTTADRSKKFKIYVDKVAVNEEVRIVELVDDHELRFTSEEKKLMFYQDAYRRIATAGHFKTSDIDFSITTRRTNTAGTYLLKLQPSVTNNPDQRWQYNIIDDSLIDDMPSNLCRVWSQTLPNSDTGFFYDPQENGKTKKLYLCALKSAPSGFVELLIDFSNITTDLGFLTPKPPLTHFVDLRLSWYSEKQFYSPLLTGWSAKGKPDPYKFLYDNKTSKIFYLDNDSKIHCLKNLRDPKSKDWDWIFWEEQPNLRNDDVAFEWYFSRGNLTIPTIEDLNLRHIRSAQNNDWLKVTYGGAEWGGWYTSKQFEDENSINAFDLALNFDR